MTIGIHVAVARNGVIGSKGQLPWRLSTDLKRFKRMTMGKPVVMGRKTWDSIGKPLPGRLNIVVTRDRDWACEGAVRAGSLDEALEIATACAAKDGADEVAVIGGGEIFRQVMARADRLYVTHVEADIDGDVDMPEISHSDWMEVTSESVPAGERDSHPTRYVEYVRVG